MSGCSKTSFLDVSVGMTYSVRYSILCSFRFSHKIFSTKNFRIFTYSPEYVLYKIKSGVRIILFFTRLFNLTISEFFISRKLFFP